MSAHGDPFRNIVKDNIDVIRSAEENDAAQREQKCKLFEQDRKEHEIYVRVLRALALTQKVNLVDLGIREDEWNFPKKDLTKQKTSSSLTTE